MRPVVRVLSADQDMTQIEAKEYDLVKERTTFIQSILE